MSKCNVFNIVKAGKIKSLTDNQMMMYNRCNVQNAYKCKYTACPYHVDFVAPVPTPKVVEQSRDKVVIKGGKE